MKAYILTIVVIDHDEIGGDEIVKTIENARYPNRCIDPHVEATAEHDIGEWDDDHPLNQNSTDALAWLRENGTPPAST